MEADILLEGFRKSEAMYGLHYAYVIGDGDSSVYHKLCNAQPYKGLRIQKIECRNHLLQNLTRKILNEIKKPARNVSSEEKDIRSKVSCTALRFCGAIFRAAEYRSKLGITNSSIKLLQADIENIPSHIFGEHKSCAQLGYFCDGKQKDGEENIMPKLRKYGLNMELEQFLRPLYTNCRSLLHNVTSNLVESCNSVVAKFVAGKRLNFTQRNSYSGRCFGAAVNFNTKSPFYKLHKFMVGHSPSVISKKSEGSSKYARNRKPSCDMKKRIQKKLILHYADQDYGPSAA